MEGTQKISLSRDDRKQLEPTPEEVFFRPVAGKPLGEWVPGKIFIASDDRSSLIFDQDGLPADQSELRLGGKELTFQGVEPRMAVDGSSTAVLIFSDGQHEFRHDSGKLAETANSQVTSDQIPMLIDKEMVESARQLLMGKKLWTRTPLWYDAEGNRVAGRKYVPVTVTDVRPGTIVFPIKVKFKDEHGMEAWAFMNFGHSGKESRGFSNLFSLSDIRAKYPNIDDETWKVITLGRLKTGMTKAECKLSLGNPNEVDSGHDYSQTLDLWHYTDGTVLWFEDGILTRYRR
nr:hypothetical protein Muribac2_030 [uncultured Muribaculaceae bacterium]